MHDIVIPGHTAWLADPAVQEILRLVREAGYEIYFVGGCVRNALVGGPDTDVDLSTNARPETVMEIAQVAGMKAVPTGISHGTVTVVSRGTGYEITTFRRDVETDGRRAVVAFSDSLEDDARRRDFTMNALYAAWDGQVIDPLGGVPDARAGRVRFIDDAAARIKEDYLRILRFFRFNAWYGQPGQGLDPEALAAIAQNLDGLETLPAERVGQEMQKLLAAPDPAPSIAVMRQVGALHKVLPGADDQWLAPLVHGENEAGVPISWLTRLAAIGGDEPTQRFRLSRQSAKRLDLLREVSGAGPSLVELSYRHGQDVGEAVLLLRAASAGNAPTRAEVLAVAAASNATFPLRAQDLMPTYSGRELGEKLEALEAKWIASNFQLTAQDLLG
ncbi:MAG: CCA tRNA nucleotidyltransferase [Pseudomonadota bacterium]